MKELPEPARAPALEDLRVNLIVQRARARLSQQDLADASGVGRNTISRIERAVGDVGLDVLYRLAAALGTSAHALIEPSGIDRRDNAEISRRAEASDEEFVNADSVLDAVDEAAGREITRYSRAGRPATVER